MASQAGIRDSERATGLIEGDGGEPERRRLRRLTLWFYLGVPVLLGLFLGWLQVGRAAGWPRSVSMIYWLGVALVTTPFNALGTALISPLLRRLRSPLWLTLFLGQILAGYVLTNPVLHGYRRWLQANVYPGLVLTPATTLPEFLQRLPTNSVIWVGTCLVFFHALRMPLFGYRPAPLAPPAPPANAASSADTPRELRPALALMERVRPERRGALLALEAEGHYLRVHTDKGSDLILYRLSDAMNELPAEDGAQVHRSWWVAARALSPERHRERLKLVNGIDVPVSRSFRVAARQRGWLTAADPRD
jgi:hypothetical protein